MKYMVRFSSFQTGVVIAVFIYAGIAFTEFVAYKEFVYIWPFLLAAFLIGAVLHFLLHAAAYNNDLYLYRTIGEDYKKSTDYLESVASVRLLNNVSCICICVPIIIAILLMK